MWKIESSANTERATRFSSRAKVRSRQKGFYCVVVFSILAQGLSIGSGQSCPGLRIEPPGTQEGAMLAS